MTISNLGGALWSIPSFLQTDLFYYILKFDLER